jgi:ferritin-like metal-binding protein YciE
LGSCVILYPCSLIKSKKKERYRTNTLLIYPNDALAMENASVERHQKRIKETDIKELKIVIHKHLPETRRTKKD